MSWGNYTVQRIHNFKSKFLAFDIKRHIIWVNLHCCIPSQGYKSRFK